MKNMAIVDSGPLIALFDLSDRYHQKAKRSLEKYRQEVRGKLITTWPIITEVAYLLKEHVHFQAQLDFLKWIGLGGLEIFELVRHHLPKVIELQNRYADLDMDLADATLIVVAESLEINKVFSIDKDFSIYRISDKRHFENLMS